MVIKENEIEKEKETEKKIKLLKELGFEESKIKNVVNKYTTIENCIKCLLFPGTFN